MTLDEKLQKEVESFRAKLADQGIRGKELEFAVREFARGHVAFRRYDQRVWARVREMEVPNIHRVPLVNLARRVYRLARANRGWFLAEQMAHHGAGLVGEGAHMDAVTAVLNHCWELLVGKPLEEKGETLNTLTRKYAGLAAKA
jgi:hypothetical protein